LLADEAPRTVARTHCKIDAFFGLVTLEAAKQVTDKLRAGSPSSGYSAPWSKFTR
jgi:hypothetical protein